jgi:hypothetical protein
MPLADRLAVCSWSLHPQSPKALADMLRAIGINRTQLALDPVRLGGEWADGPAKLVDLGVTVASGMVTTVGEDYSTLETIKVTGGVVPDATWPQTFANFTQMALIAQRAGMDQMRFTPGSAALSWIPNTGSPVAPVGSPTCSRIMGRSLETGQEAATDLRAFLGPRQAQRPRVRSREPDPGDKGDPIAAR